MDGRPTAPPLGQTGAPLTPTAPLPLGPLPGSRYPDAHLESLRKPKGALGPAGFPAFAGTNAVERLATGFRWAEGPVYFPAGRYLLHVWYEGAPPESLRTLIREITVSEDLSTLGVLRLTEVALPRTHRNKYDREYEPSAPIDSPGYQQP